MKWPISPIYHMSFIALLQRESEMYGHSTPHNSADHTSLFGARRGAQSSHKTLGIILASKHPNLLA